MPDFRYRAVDGDGRGVTGIMTAFNEEMLEAKLAEIGHWLVSAKEVSEGRDRELGGGLFAKKLRRRDQIDFFLQSNSLLSSGVSLIEVLKTIGQDADNPKMGAVLADLARNVEAGYSLHEAMERHTSVFSREIASMVRAGEEGGTLPETFRGITAYLEWLDRLMGDIKQATIYPAAVLLALVLFITVLFTFVVPKFTAILVALGISLPWPTRLIIGISEFFVATWWFWFVAVLATPPAVRAARTRSEWFRLRWDRAKLSLPVFGPLNRMFTISRFAQTFSTLFRSGIPVLQNLALCQPVVGNKVLEDALTETERDMREGEPMSDCFRRHEIFTPMVLRMIAVGESTGDIGAALQNVADYYNEEIPRKVKRVFAVVEPAIMLFLIGVVGVTAMAIFMPILSLMGGIK